jgi:hypothetical protein
VGRGATIAPNLYRPIGRTITTVKILNTWLDLRNELTVTCLVTTMEYSSSLWNGKKIDE